MMQIKKITNHLSWSRVSGVRIFFERRYAPTTAKNISSPKALTFMRSLYLYPAGKNNHVYHSVPRQPAGRDSIRHTDFKSRVVYRDKETSED